MRGGRIRRTWGRSEVWEGRGGGGGGGGVLEDVEGRGGGWWLGLGDHPTSELYDRATVGILTSFLARAWAAGERFEGFEVFARTRPEALKQPEGQWLPPTLFGMGVAE